jgi:3-oxoacyl-[acyl-carrier-protein] synthase-1
MIVTIAHNIVSPLGFTTQENLEGVLAGRSQLRRYEGLWGLPDPVVLSLIDDQRLNEAFAAEVRPLTNPHPEQASHGEESAEPYTRFERMALLSATKALAAATPWGIDASSPRTIFILSTTKGNVSLLHNAQPTVPPPTSGSVCCSTAATRPRPSAVLPDRILPGTSALLLSRHFGNPNEPIVVSNACTSGLCALVVAQRCLQSGQYDTAVVVGADEQSPFIVNGFQSLHALSAHPCQPFSENRLGLNLGEAAATMVLQRLDGPASSLRPNTPSLRPVCRCTAATPLWAIAGAAIRNDAHHISSPSRTAEGAYRALRATLEQGHSNAGDLAAISVHGTATLYNDEMEAMAIQRAGLSEVPATGLKGVFGHTMGAAGLLETILTQAATEQHVVLPTRGFDALGVSRPVNISADARATDRTAFVKMLSGFGGCNAAMLWKLCAPTVSTPSPAPSATADSACCCTAATNMQPRITHRVVLTPTGATVDGQVLDTQAHGWEMLTELYRKRINDYPRYFKMDPLCRLGFVASELLLQAEGKERFSPREDRGVVFFNRSASLMADKAFERTIADAQNRFPSPAAFVYTLPNIVTGEVAMRNQYFGETNFMVLPRRDDRLIALLAEQALASGSMRSLIAGWLEASSDDRFEADIYLLENE